MDTTQANHDVISSAAVGAVVSAAAGRVKVRALLACNGLAGPLVDARSIAPRRGRRGHECLFV